MEQCQRTKASFCHRISITLAEATFRIEHLILVLFSCHNVFHFIYFLRIFSTSLLFTYKTKTMMKSEPAQKKLNWSRHIARSLYYFNLYFSRALIFLLSFYFVSRAHTLLFKVLGYRYCLPHRSQILVKLVCKCHKQRGKMV